MVSVTFLLGLAGSGKSDLAEELSRQTGAVILEGIAGVHNPDALPTLIRHLKGGQNCVVEEAAFCIQENRDWITTWLRARIPDIDMKWICFDNDLDTANWNVINRKNKAEIEKHLRINDFYHSRYTCPEGAEHRSIFRVPPRSD